MSKKVCTKCNIEKELNDFHKNKKSKDGHLTECKTCRNEYASAYSKKYYLANKEKVKARTKKNAKNYRKNNKERIKKYNKKYNKKYYKSKTIKLESNLSPEQLLKKREKDNARSRKYYHKNKKKRVRYSVDYKKRRYNNDSKFRLKLRISSAIRKAITRNGYEKKSNTCKILGCTYDNFFKHLNNNPYGFSIENVDLDIDHIIPISDASTEEEILELNHYSNLQLLPSDYNRNIKKNNPFDKEHFENWLEENQVLIN